MHALLALALLLGAHTNKQPSVVYDDMRFGALALKLGPASAPDFVKVLDDGGGSTGVYTYCFDDSSTEMLHGTMQLSHGYKPGEDYDVHVHVFTLTGNAGDARLGIEYVTTNPGDAFAAATTVVETVVAVAGTARLEQLFDITTISGTGIKESGGDIFRIYREGGDATDTLVGDLCLKEADFHIPINKLGTGTEVPGT